MEANAADPAGAQSLADALGDHSAALADNPSLGAIDTTDGAKIVSNIFGASEPEVVNRLGGQGSLSSGLVSKLLPILAPIVMAWLVKQVEGKMGGAAASPDPSQSQPQSAQGGIGDILGQILGGAVTQSQAQPQAQSPASGGAGDILGTILGGLLGGGRR